VGKIEIAKVTHGLDRGCESFSRLPASIVLRNGIIFYQIDEKTSKAPVQFPSGIVECSSYPVSHDVASFVLPASRLGIGIN
jgi:hypothetical protein